MIRHTLIACILAIVAAITVTGERFQNVASLVATPAFAQGNCNPRDNLNETAESFIGRCCKGSILSVFPSEYLSSTLERIQNNCKVGSRRDCDDGDDDSFGGLQTAKNARTAWKLLSRSEYRK